MINYAKRCGTILSGLTLLSLLGCSTPSTLTKVERLTPPTEYIQDCPGDGYKVVLTGDLPEALRRSRAALKLCNADKAALRAWAAGVQ